MGEGPLREDYRALELLDQGLKSLNRELRSQARGYLGHVAEDLLMDAVILLDHVHEIHFEVRESVPPEYWITDPSIRGKVLERSLAAIAEDRELLVRLGRAWRERAGAGGAVREPTDVDYGYSRLVANEVRLLVELGLPFAAASRIVRRAWPSEISRRGSLVNPYLLMVSLQGPLSLMAVSSFSLQWFATSLAVRLQQALAESQDDPGWNGRVHRILKSASARSAMAVVQSADTYLEPGGDPLTVFLAGVQVGLDTAVGNFDESASTVNEIVAGFVGATIPDDFAESV